MFDESKYLFREDLVKERTTQDFCEWTESKLIEWSSIERTAPDGQELHERVIMRRGLFGPFYQEVVPFCRYLQASRKVSPDYRCEIHLDSSHHFDATLNSNKDHTFYEITQAIEDRNDVRMEQFLLHGQVNALGTMTISGTKKSGRNVIIEDEFVAHDDVIANLQILVLKRLERKTGGATKNQIYDPQTKLIITIDDYQFRREDHKPLHQFFVGSAIAEQQTFQSVIIIGIGGRFFSEYRRI